MQIRILCVGKLKEKSLKALCEEYQKRLGRYTSLEIVEVPDEPAPESLSAAMQEKVKQAEGARLLQKSRPGYKIALCLEGKQWDSPGLAEKIRQLENRGTGCVQFYIGGSLGLSDEVIRACDEGLSLSKLTFPHNLARLLLLEQIYRSYKINRGETYHK
ncbi:MAG: 23S rRNA (pseudouridine(1915)-N(3))-methyltransferase RlmH [Christensenellales bacterium]|jgi:23S rRNA (pseudouridine1915-N3)-methyltransferase